MTNYTQSTFGAIDILINNAGSAGYGNFLELEDQVLLDAWHLKLLGYIRLVRAVAPGFIERRDGRIVNIVGSAGRTPPARSLAGGTANAALLNFTRGVTAELASHNIRINAISPARRPQSGLKTRPSKRRSLRVLAQQRSKLRPWPPFRWVKLCSPKTLPI